MDRIPLLTNLPKMTMPPLTTEGLQQTLTQTDLPIQRRAVQIPEDLKNMGMGKPGCTATEEASLGLTRITVTSMTIIPLSPVMRRMSVVALQAAKSRSLYAQSSVLLPSVGYQSVPRIRILPRLFGAELFSRYSLEPVIAWPASRLSRDLLPKSF